MPNNLTDNEIKKALECCSINKGCTGCYFNTHETDDMCPRVLMRNALDLINRLQAEKMQLESEVERLKDETAEMLSTLDYRVEKILELVDKLKVAQAENERLSKITRTMVGEIKAEAYTEFVERLKDGTGYYDEMIKDVVYTEEEVDNLLKEMVGEDNASKT